MYTILVTVIIKFWLNSPVVNLGDFTSGSTVKIDCKRTNGEKCNDNALNKPRKRNGKKRREEMCVNFDKMGREQEENRANLWLEGFRGREKEVDKTAE